VQPDPQLPEGGAEPRWPAVVALLSVGGPHLALPVPLLALGPRWLLLAFVSFLLIPTVISHRGGHDRAIRVCGWVVAVVVTVFTIVSLILLVHALLHPGEPTSQVGLGYQAGPCPKTGSCPQLKPLQLLRSAAALWVTNVLVFALWYWHLDAGGPHRRDQRKGHPDGAFLFLR
jgi:hypothetical protein